MKNTDKEKLRLTFEKISDELSETNNLDDILNDEGIDPTALVNSGLERIKALQSMSATEDSATILVRIQKKIESLKLNPSSSALKSFENWLPKLNENQLLAVFQKVNSVIDENDDESDLIAMKKEVLLRQLMDEFNGGPK